MMRRVLHYSIHQSPSWANPTPPFALVCWVLEPELGTGAAMPAEGFGDLDAARAAIPGRIERTRVPAGAADEDDLVETWV